jgi:hypothetical protein
MSLTKILNEKDADADDQLSRVQAIVGSARKAYGNEEAVIEAPRVTTPDGTMSFNHLGPKSQVETLRGQIGGIKAAAIEFVEQTPGASLDRAVEELLATNPYFTSVGNGTKFAYL